jgi:hypothetical protein
MFSTGTTLSLSDARLALPEYERGVLDWQEPKKLVQATNEFDRTEAPRPVCDRNDGRSPGLRVHTPHRIPCSLSLERPSIALLNG